ncbi:cytochrome o ubiquinol oxidase subunit III [Candidatus Protochlamydia phocaeensis]|uniref:cytochrome o ubiquinol oxidase subunit III n=1 Tax=Candidatus Protochlamydia phocaeensis TaxID=1414722 RepID=UPI000838D539|nr:cytochrome o ubiquinol oxidase subunit III [Candidatus Protochlamydia phocaeensis]
MTDSITAQHHTQDVYSRTVFGFWLYLMSDCILFATLFATYAVLHNNTFGGPSSRELYDLPYALIETLILLTSSFTCGLGMLYARRYEYAKVYALFGITFLLGLSFLTLELREFVHMVQEGNSWQRSGFLSSYFTLVGTHGLHITSGLLWMIVVMALILFNGLTDANLRKLMCFSLFWHFLDVIWIFIFTIVYLMGSFT